MTQTLPEVSTAIPVGEVNPVIVGQEEGGEQEVLPTGIFVTDPEVEESLVTQTLWLESTAIPAGVNPREIRGQSFVVAQEVAVEGISMTPYVLIVATQMLLFPLSTAIVPKAVTLGGEKVEEGGGLPPVPPPNPQEARERRNKRPERMRPRGRISLKGPTLFFIRFPPDLSNTP